MIFETYTLDKSREEYSLMLENGIDQISYENLDDNYKTLRNDLLAIFGEVEKTYEYDLKVGIKIYNYFNQIKGFNETIASNYGFWRYISLKVIPDIVFKRHGVQSEYYFSKNVRIYISTLWWYIHLSFQSNEEETLNALKELSTDYILNLVERPGKKGSFLTISRALIKYISKLPKKIRNEKKGGSNLFRRVLLLNTAKINNYNLVFEGEENEYVRSLLKQCGIEEDVLCSID